MKSEIVSIRHKEFIPQSPNEYDNESIKIIYDLIKDQLFEDLGFKTDYFKGKKILIKPNLVRPDLKNRPAVSTDPRVIIALSKLLKDLGSREISVGENPGYGYPAKLAFRSGGLYHPLKKLGINMVFFDEGKWIKRELDDKSLLRYIYVPEEILRSDIVINVPKMKTHMHTLVSLSLKNLQGIINDPQRRIFHRNDIEFKIVDVYLAFKPHLNIVDGIWAMEGQAPFFGDVIKDFNVLIIGENAVSVDAVASYLMGYIPEEITHLRLAHSLGLGEINIDAIDIRGDDVKKIRRFFKRPILSSVGISPNLKVIEGGACSGCLSALRHSVDQLKYFNLIEKLPPITVYIGKPMPNTKTYCKFEKDLWLFGNCAIDIVYSHNEMRNRINILHGCPPHVLDFYLKVVKFYGLK